MPALIDRTGQKFNRLTFIKYKGDRKWLIRCDCGKEKLMLSSGIIAGTIKSCGCYNLELITKRAKDINFKDITGQTFNRLTAIKYEGNSRWLFDCSCGNRKSIVGYDVLQNRIKSCGCYSIECLTNGSQLRHGHNKKGKTTRVYNIWAKMKYRCLNPKELAYPRYGGRGIRICDRWLRFENFLEDMGEPTTKKHSIDRINNDGNYEPSNCRWATTYEQTRNYSRNVNFTHNGKTMCLSDWSIELGLSRGMVSQRINTYGWTIEEALNLASKPRRS